VHTFDTAAAGAKKGKAAAAAAPAHHSVLVPQGTLKPTGISSSFQHNEFLVYTESQQRIRYILTFHA
jgi:hypothetical protein